MNEVFLCTLDLFLQLYITNSVNMLNSPYDAFEMKRNSNNLNLEVGSKFNKLNQKFFSFYLSQEFFINKDFKVEAKRIHYILLVRVLRHITASPG